nr:hypothetical protein CFP56_34910 [Quercus suber]
MCETADLARPWARLDRVARILAEAARPDWEHADGMATHDGMGRAGQKGSARCKRAHRFPPREYLNQMREAIDRVRYAELQSRSESLSFVDHRGPAPTTHDKHDDDERLREQISTPQHCPRSVRRRGQDGKLGGGRGRHGGERSGRYRRHVARKHPQALRHGGMERRGRPDVCIWCNRPQGRS